MIREVAWRLFASEYNDANLETEGTGERPPSYIVTPLGAKVNRVFVVGVITDVENVGTDGQPMWRARVSDPTGTFHVYAGQYQPEAAATLSKLKPPVFGAIVGKSRIYSPQPGTTYTSIRPETIKAVDETVRDFWILEACRSLRKRLDAMGEAQKMDPLTKEGLVKIGVKEAIADGIVQAMNHYGKVDLSRYTAMLAEGLRYLLPEYREPTAPGEPVVEAAAPAGRDANLRAAPQAAAHLHPVVRHPVDPSQPDSPHDEAAGPTHRAEGEVQEDRQTGGPDRPALGDEQRLEYVDADEPSEGST